MFMHNAAAFRAVETISLADLRLPPARGAAAPGMLAGTFVETAAGWCRAEALVPGMRVQTWDGGLVAVARIARQAVPTASELVQIPGGALGCCSDLWLMPGQQVLVAAPVAEDLLDAAGALVPARALAGHMGVRLVRAPGPVDALSLTLDSEELVFANTGALLRCGGGAGSLSGYLPELGGAQAEAFLRAVAGDLAAGLRIAA